MFLSCESRPTQKGLNLIWTHDLLGEWWHRNSMLPDRNMCANLKKQNKVWWQKLVPNQSQLNPNDELDKQCVYGSPWLILISQTTGSEANCKKKLSTYVRKTFNYAYKPSIFPQLNLYVLYKQIELPQTFHDHYWVKLSNKHINIKLWNRKVTYVGGNFVQNNYFLCMYTLVNKAQSSFLWTVRIDMNKHTEQRVHAASFDSLN